jgi:hypothetical protein
MVPNSRPQSSLAHRLKLERVSHAHCSEVASTIFKCWSQAKVHDLTCLIRNLHTVVVYIYYTIHALAFTESLRDYRNCFWSLSAPVYGARLRLGACTCYNDTCVHISDIEMDPTDPKLHKQSLRCSNPRWLQSQCKCATPKSPRRKPPKEKPPESAACNAATVPVWRLLRPNSPGTGRRASFPPHAPWAAAAPRCGSWCTRRSRPGRGGLLLFPLRRSRRTGPSSP